MLDLKTRLFILLLLLFRISVAQEVVQYTYGLSKFALPAENTDRLITRASQNLLLNGNQLYIIPEGTGRIYRLDYQHSLQPVRIDSTIYFGSTFGSQSFFYKDTLYSFGGYGYWHINGQLRVYVPQKGEWELEPLNKEVPFLKNEFPSLVWMDERNGKLWLANSNYYREGIKRNGGPPNVMGDSVFFLNLKSKEISAVGLLNDLTKETSRKISVRHLVNSPWGQLTCNKVGPIIYLLDFECNQQLTLSQTKAKEIMRIIPSNGLLHFKDSTLIIQSFDNWLRGDFKSGDSVRLTRTDFTPTNPIYEDFKSQKISANQSISYLNLLVSFLTGCAFAGLVLYLGIIRPQSNRKRSQDKLVIAFSEKEREVIGFIAMNSTNEVGTTVDQINQLLGVTKKNVEIQKKQRSDMFLTINEKWNRVSDKILIDKKRLNHDKRSYEYLITPDQLNKIQSMGLI